jgi:hypothetical protein
MGSGLREPEVFPETVLEAVPVLRTSCQAIVGRFTVATQEQLPAGTADDKRRTRHRLGRERVRLMSYAETLSLCRTPSSSPRGMTVGTTGGTRMNSPSPAPSR